MKKSLSLIWMMVMLVGLLPANALAAETTEATEATEPTEFVEFASPEAEVTYEHEYTAVVTTPTCTQQGYTTYTCACGDSYVSDYTDPLKLTIIPITSAEVEQGGYYYGRDSQSKNRLRVVEQIYVEAGTTVQYNANGMRLFFAIVSGPDANCYLEGGNWYTDSGEFEVQTDGYLSIIISKTDPQAEITVSDFVADVDIYMLSECAHEYKVVVTPATYTANGCATHTCTKCGHRYVTDYEEAEHFKILLIGNSFSEDAMRQFRTAAKSLLGADAKVDLHLAINAGKTIAWHASQADDDAASYKHRYDTEETGRMVYEDAPLSRLSDLLQLEDWDVVTLQSFYPEVNTGTAEGKDGEKEAFLSMDVSVPYMLDVIEQYAPQADIYYYMAWQSTVDTVKLDAGREGFEQILTNTQKVVHYTGTNSGKGFSGVIPVGTAIQNARSTYLGLLDYRTDAETVIGLQRDSVHMAYTYGGYIAAMTFAEYLFPEEVRVAGYVPAGVKNSAVLGALPEEYTDIAQKAVRAAIESPYSVTALSGYEKDPDDVAKAAIEAAQYDFTGISDAASLETAILDAVKDSIVKSGFAAPAVSVRDFKVDKDGTVTDVTAEVTVRFGYTTRTAFINKHTHTYLAVITPPTCTEQGYTTYTCRCGDSYVGDYVEAKGHTEAINPAVAETCTTTGLTEGKHCSACGVVLIPQQTVIAKGHSWDNGTVTKAPTEETEGEKVYTCTVCGETRRESVPVLSHTHSYSGVVTAPACTEQGYTVYTCRCGESYKADYVAARGHVYDSDRDAQCNACGAEREVQKTAVRGKVKNAKDGAKVTLTGTASYETAVSGSEYTFDNAEQGQYDLQIKQAGCLTYTVKNISIGEEDVTLPEVTLVQGDVTGDEKINMQDLRVFLQNFNKVEEKIDEPLTDVNSDRKVNMQDLRVFLQNFNKTAEKDCTISCGA